MKKTGWLLAFCVVFIATIIDLFVPDPLPFIEEVLGIAGSIWIFIRKIRKK